VIEHPSCYIDGQWSGPENPVTVDVVDPSTEEPFGTVQLGGPADVDRAVAAARAAFAGFAATSVAERLDLLDRITAAYTERLDRIAELISREMGAPRALAESAQAPAGLAHLARTAEALDGFEFTERRGTSELRHVPIGVCGLITPWNWPANQIMCKVAPALAAGCTMVLKPSEFTPFSALVIAEAIDAAGVPPGVFNLVVGDGPGVGAAIAAHPGIDMVSFTGSTRAGKRVSQVAAETVKKVALELGGKSANIVLADCPDLDAAATAAAYAIFFNQGEMCSAGSRLLVHESVREAMLEKIAKVARELAPGDPLDPATRLGAIVDETQLGRVLDYIESGRQEGAQLHVGGAQARRDSGGYYIEPTVFDRVTPGMRIAREEIFGPGLACIAFEDPAEAVRIANDSEYGLAAAVWSRDLSTAHGIARRLRAGMVYVNCYDADDITVPFGGYKQSGMGRDKSLHAFDKYTELKTTWIELG